MRRARALSFLSGSLDSSALQEHNLTEAAIRFNLSLQGVTTVLGGFSEKKQVEEIAACSGNGLLSEQNMVRVEMAWRANFGLDS